MPAARSARFLVLGLLASSCTQDSSSSPLRPLPVVTNLGLAAGHVLGDGDVRLLLVSEAEQGRDLDGDGDLVDHVAFVADLAAGAVVETGLAVFVPSLRSDPVPPPVASVGEALAFGVSESETGGIDRNGDGDALDLVLALYERETRTVTNLGIAVRRVSASRDLVAFEVPEAAEGGQDLNGDGVVDIRTAVAFVHDRRTGETWSTGLWAEVLGVQGEHVALAVVEAGGDRNGDGDRHDWVFELHDVRDRTQVPSGLALNHTGFGIERPVALGGWWAISVDELAQGSQDLSGDGDARDDVTIVVETATGRQVNVGEHVALELGPDAPAFVLQERAPFASLRLFEPLGERFTDTGWIAHSPMWLGPRLVVTVDERFQQEDLDRDGALESWVTVVVDPSSGADVVIPRDGFAIERDGGLLLHVRELVSRDWNGDGDLLDVVLHTWDARTGALASTGLALAGTAAPLGADDALVTLFESDIRIDANGDGDLVDRILHVLDLDARRARSLGIAVAIHPDDAGSRALLRVRESEAGADLNGDGDLEDLVLHIVEPAEG